MELKNKIFIYFLIMISSILFSTAFAEFNGPTVVLEGNWGDDNNQFGIEYQDNFDIFPKLFRINSNGNIVISDQVNRRIKNYNSTGKLENIILPQGISQDIIEKLNQWPTKIFFISDDCVLTMISKYTQIYSLEGNLFKNLSFPTIKGYVMLMFPNGSFITKGANEVYYKYSVQGELIQTYSSKPLELGDTEEKRLNNDTYSLTIKYPDKIFNITVPDQRPDNIIKDKFAYIYIIQRLVNVLYAGTDNEDITEHYRVIRYDDTNELGRLDLPENEYEIIGEDDVVGKLKQVVVEYGEPFVAPNGDIYTWKRTLSKYHIIKWNWID